MASSRLVTRALQTGIPFRPPQRHQQREAVLLKKFLAHEAAVTAAVVVRDDVDQNVVTSSFDRSLAYWYLHQSGLENKLETARIACGRPVLSLDRQGAGVYCAKAGGENEVCRWDPPKAGFRPRVVLGPHGGWVRDMECYGQWMFSCDCQTLRQWDLSWLNPRHLKDVKVEKGDILNVATGDGKVFVATTEGTVYAWEVKENGEMVPMGHWSGHEGRINAIVVHDGVLYSAGNDGSIKAWSTDSHECIAIFNNAHEGKKINCLAVSSTGVVYSGAEGEGIVRRWNGERLFPCQRPLHCHHRSIRVLTLGDNDTLVVGDAGGVVSFWKV